MSIWDIVLSPSGRRFYEEIRIDPDAFLAFYDYAKQQRVIENLHFALSAEEYASLPCSERRSREEELMEQYIREDSPQKINITDDILKTLQSDIGYGRARVFDAAAAHCIEMMALGPWADFKGDYFEKTPRSPTIYTQEKLSSVLSERVDKNVFPAVLWAFNRSRTRPYMAPPLNAGQMQKWLYSSPQVAKVLAHSFLLDADPVAIKAALCLLPFISDKLFMELLTNLLDAELKTLDSSDKTARGQPAKELKDFSKLMVTMIVFEELCSLVARDWLNKLLEPVVTLLYASTPHSFALDSDENMAQTEHTAYTIADRLLDVLEDSPPPPSILYVCNTWSEIIHARNLTVATPRVNTGKIDSNDSSPNKDSKPTSKENSREKPSKTPRNEEGKMDTSRREKREKEKEKEREKEREKEKEKEKERLSPTALEGPLPWILRIICESLLVPNQRLTIPFHGGISGYRMAVLVTDLVYSIYSPPGFRSYSVSARQLDFMKSAHSHTFKNLTEKFVATAKFEKVKLESDLEGSKHLAYHLCAVADSLRKTFSDEDLGSLITFFQLNEVFTKKLKPMLGARWQDKEEGYQNVFATEPDGGASELSKSKRSKGSRSSKDKGSPPKGGGGNISDTDSETTPREGGRKIKKSASQEEEKNSKKGFPVSFGSLFGKSKKEPSLSRSAPPGKVTPQGSDGEDEDESTVIKPHSDKGSKGKGKEKEKSRKSRKSESPRSDTHKPLTSSNKASPRSKSETNILSMNQSSEVTGEDKKVNSVNKEEKEEDDKKSEKEESRKDKLDKSRDKEDSKKDKLDKSREKLEKSRDKEKLERSKDKDKDKDKEKKIRHVQL